MYIKAFWRVVKRVLNQPDVKGSRYHEPELLMEGSGGLNSAMLKVEEVNKKTTKFLLIMLDQIWK